MSLAVMPCCYAHSRAACGRAARASKEPGAPRRGCVERTYTLERAVRDDVAAHVRERGVESETAAAPLAAPRWPDVQLKVLPAERRQPR